MRWRPEGAQAMLDLRATYLNEEWESFWTYHVEQEDERLYAFQKRAAPSGAFRGDLAG
jgi:hypothetical protein